MPPVFWISGPPAAGKTTLCELLLARFDLGLHIPVDDMRQWVLSGMADSVPWTEATETQFQLVEVAACDVARRYHRAGFAVALDHCRNMPRLESVIAQELAGIAVVKVCLMPDLDTNLRRNRERTNKQFEPQILDETITWTNTNYRREVPPGWLVLDTTHMTPEETVSEVMRACDQTQPSRLAACDA